MDFGRKLITLHNRKRPFLIKLFINIHCIPCKPWQTAWRSFGFEPYAGPNDCALLCEDPGFNISLSVASVAIARALILRHRSWKICAHFCRARSRESYFPRTLKVTYSFLHVGACFSSFPVWFVWLQDKQFGKVALFFPHTNPEADIISGIKCYKLYSLKRAYLGEAFFWGLLPQPGDQLIFKFKTPIHIKRYRCICYNHNPTVGDAKNLSTL